MIYVFAWISENSINLLIGFYNQGRESLLRSIDWVFKSDGQFCP